MKYIRTQTWRLMGRWLKSNIKNRRSFYQHARINTGSKRLFARLF